MLPGIGVFLGVSIVPGSETYSTPGTYTFTPPSAYNTLTIQVWGGGGSGAVFFKLSGDNYSYGGKNGNNSSVVTSIGTLTANAGLGNGTGGSGSGPAGSTVVNGGDGTLVYSQTGVTINSTGGNAGGPGGGIGSTGAVPGGAPGGGSGGYCTNTAGGSQTSVKGGGAAGYVSLSTTSAITTAITVNVGAGAAASYSGNTGGDGKVVISWT